MSSLSVPAIIEDYSVYWASSGWDLGMLLDAEVSVADLRRFLVKYPSVAGVRRVKYSLAVRLARIDQYEEAAQIYESANARKRAFRMRQLASLYREANRTDVPTSEALYKLAEFLNSNPDRVYFNDDLWYGFQRYALFADKDSRLTGAERKKQLALERKLKDDQEERWRAYLLLRDVVRQTGSADLRRKSALLAVRCLDAISERFGREDDIRVAQAELIKFLRSARTK